MRVDIPIRAEHILAGSPGDRMSGRNRLSVFGVVEKLESDRIHCGAYYVGTVVPRGDPTYLVPPSGWYWRDYQSVPLADINEFSRVSGEAMASKSARTLLKNIPERDIKRAICEILMEDVPKDWGGEQSDLFSANIRVKDRPTTASFLLKGPASFKPMKMTHLGKNGDQIDRLFAEGSELCVLQHCHDITPPVRNMMKAYASRMGDPRLFTIIDGRQTIRILRAYAKLGQSHVPPEDTATYLARLEGGDRSDDDEDDEDDDGVRNDEDDDYSNEDDFDGSPDPGDEVDDDAIPDEEEVNADDGD